MFQSRMLQVKGELKLNKIIKDSALGRGIVFDYTSDVSFHKTC